MSPFNGPVSPSSGDTGFFDGRRTAARASRGVQAGIAPVRAAGRMTLGSTSATARVTLHPEPKHSFSGSSSYDTLSFSRPVKSLARGFAHA